MLALLASLADVGSISQPNSLKEQINMPSNTSGMHDHNALLTSAAIISTGVYCACMTIAMLIAYKHNSLHNPDLPLITVVKHHVFHLFIVDFVLLCM